MATLLAAALLVVGTAALPTHAEAPAAGPVHATFTGYDVHQVVLCSQACHSRLDAGSTTARASRHWIGTDPEMEVPPVPPGAYRLAVYVGGWTYGYLRRSADGRYDVVPTFDEGTDVTVAGTTDLGEIRIRRPDHPEGELDVTFDGYLWNSTAYLVLHAAKFAAGTTVTVRQTSCLGAKSRVLTRFDPSKRKKVEFGLKQVNIGPDYHVSVDVTAPGRTTRRQGVPSIPPLGSCDAHRLVSGDGITWSDVKGKRDPVVGRVVKVTPFKGEDAVVTYRWKVGKKIVSKGTKAADRRLKIKRAWLGKEVRVLVDAHFPAGTKIDSYVFFGWVTAPRR